VGHQVQASSYRPSFALSFFLTSAFFISIEIHQIQIWTHQVKEGFQGLSDHQLFGLYEAARHFSGQFVLPGAQPPSLHFLLRY
jgi:hypothetical protein